MKNLNIIFIIDTLDTGGRERQLIEIIKSPNFTKNYKIGLITFTKNGFYDEIVKRYCYNFKYINKEKNKINPLFKLLKLCKYNKPKLIVSWDSFSSFYIFIISKIFKIKNIDFSIRDAGVEKGLEYLLKRILLKSSNQVLANSYAGLKYYRTDGDVIYNAINLKMFSKTVSTDEFNIIMVANFSDYKDQKTFIDAAKILIKENIIDFAYLAGSGKYENKYKKLVKEFGNNISKKIIFLGSISNVEYYLSKCKIGILCSTKKYGEGISNSVLEYMAAGLTPIATNVGGIPEIIRDGYNGYLVEEGDYNSICNIIKRIKDDGLQRNKIQKNAIKTLKRKFDYEKNIGKLIKIIDKTYE